MPYHNKANLKMGDFIQIYQNKELQLLQLDI